ncbi:hypothetical protein M1R55_19105 (plasmid) [Deinococcus sp. QL22]|nr:hypothetical protein [Deinococcus sp. QL22]UQN08190.1 hypothetical protein M1R55_19105 [Deinococcus sp. QL22]
MKNFCSGNVRVQIGQEMHALDYHNRVFGQRALNGGVQGWCQGTGLVIDSGEHVAALGAGHKT